MSSHMNPSAGRKFHLIGIGGAGMSVVADLLRAAGAQVSGSDRQPSPVLERLQQNGIAAYSPHDAERLPTDAVIVVSSAIQAENPELARAKQLRLKILHRSQALALAAGSRKFIAVAGTHGKTTTSAMTAYALQGAGLDPSYAIGASLVGIGSGGHLGDDPILVAEADESDGSFLNYTPTIEIITNVEPDHLDHYGTIEALQQVFSEFVEQLVPGGYLICCAEDETAVELADDVRQRRPDLHVLTYGRPEASIGTPFAAITDIELEPAGAKFKLTCSGTCSDEQSDKGSHSQAQGTNARPESESARESSGEVRVQLAKTGLHNVLNAAAAWLAAISVGADPNAAAAALANFQGASRRFELRGNVAARRVYDDYAHHPTEVAFALKQAKLAVQDGNNQGRVIAVFQPHLYSRTRIFQSEFAQALAAADHVVLAPIYAARETPEPGVDTELIAGHLRRLGHRHCQVAESADAAILRAARIAEPGDLLLAIGAGDINQSTHLALDYWDSL